MRPFAVVVLAAGGSSRLGRPKQLLQIGHQSLVNRAIATAEASGAAQVIVVLGARGDEIEATLESKSAQVVQNRKWREGMAGSIRCSLPEIRADIDQVVLMLADTPGVSADLITELAVALEDRPVAATDYGDLLGTPAAFRRERFWQLEALEGDEGARHIVRGEPQVGRVRSSAAAVDIDTPADVDSLA